MPDTTDADSADHVTTTPDMAGDVRYEAYQGEEQLPMIAGIVDKDLSEPYSIYTYRFFLHNWPSLTFLVRTFPSFLLFSLRFADPDPPQAFVDDTFVGVVIGKLELRKGVRRGYIGMLAVDTSQRKRGIGSSLVRRCIEQMEAEGCEEVRTISSPFVSIETPLLLIICYAPYLLLTCLLFRLFWKQKRATRARSPST